MIRLTVPEIRALLVAVAWARAPEPAPALAWSVWRREHQYRARHCHYKARGAKPP